MLLPKKIITIIIWHNGNKKPPYWWNTVVLLLWRFWLTFIKTLFILKTLIPVYICWLNFNQQMYNPSLSFHYIIFIKCIALPFIITENLLFLQCLFLIWCMAPVTWNGSEILYKRVIRPFFLKHQATMESMVSDLSAKAKNITETVTKEGEPFTVYMQVQPCLYSACIAATH